MAGTEVGSSLGLADWLPQAADPAKTPQPLSLYVFLFMAAALTLLFLSMLRHMRRARRNLDQPDAAGAADPGPTATGPGSVPQG